MTNEFVSVQDSTVRVRDELDILCLRIMAKRASYT